MVYFAEKVFLGATTEKVSPLKPVSERELRCHGARDSNHDPLATLNTGKEMMIAAENVQNAPIKIKSALPPPPKAQNTPP